MAKHVPEAVWRRDKSRLKPLKSGGEDQSLHLSSAAPQLLILGVTAAAVPPATAGLSYALTDRGPLLESLSDSWSLLYKRNNSN